MFLTRGERFKDAREVHNQHGKQTMAEVYAATGVSASCIKELEDDDTRRNVGYETIAKLARHYGVPSDFLLGLTEDPKIIPRATEQLGLSAAAIENIQAESKDTDTLSALNFMLSIDFDTFHRLNKLIFKALSARKKKESSRIIKPLSNYIPPDKWAETMGYLEQWNGEILNSIEACEFYESQAEKLFRSILERIGKKMEADNGEHS